MGRGWKRSTVFASSLVALLSLGVTGTASASPAGSGPSDAGSGGGSFDLGNGANSCQLANGITHVVEIGFDNVHFFRDNPDVPSDMEMLPNLLNFLEDNGTVLSNNHTPLIAHTADDLLTTFTGLYGDRQGMPVANDYQASTRTVRPTPPARSPTGQTPSTTRRRRRTPALTPTRTWSTRPPRPPPPRRRRRRT
jgi:hypothetical protein